jgi:hypothetical protein
VVADTNATPLVIAGGGAGAGTDINSFNKLSVEENGVDGAGKSGGSNGSGGQGYLGGGGGGFLTNGIGINSQGGKSYQAGLTGGFSGTGIHGGFGGGGGFYSSSSSYKNSGGGGGYSGGGGSNTYSDGPGGGGGSFNSGTNQTNLIGFNGGHGFVRIYRAEGVTPTLPEIIILSSSWQPQASIFKLFQNLGPQYRAATPEEITKVREATTPGGVNNWTATNQVKPRNLPGKVNEYGFDVSTTDGLWVIKE